ncbi:MAG: protein kinase [Acidobacteriota bacterium]
MKPLAQNTMIQNRYLIVHLIGKGGMGEVYLAVDQRLGSAIALKRTYFAGDEMLGNAFEREARILARMRHPVLPKVSDHFSENEEQYLVMEHISGDDIAKRLEISQKPFPVSWVMFWADQLLDALSYLHSHEPPIIHRDIKPQNLKLTDENHIILLDFGLSKSSTGQTHLSKSGVSTGSVVGYTPHYAPMEQIRGIGTNARSDLYSLAATLYQLMTNVVPADALTRADTMLNELPDPIKPPHELNHEIPAAVSKVILKGMEVSQEKRFGTAREMQKALRKAFSQVQDAMSAQTVAFTADSALHTSAIDQPASSSFQDPPLVDTTNIVSDPAKEPYFSQPSAANAAPPVDFDATLAYDPNAMPIVDQQPESNSFPDTGFQKDSAQDVRQADVKTEVFLAGSTSFPFAQESTPSVTEPPLTDNFNGGGQSASDTSNFRVENPDTGGFNPQETVPLISYKNEGETAGEEFYTSPGFVADNSGESGQGTDEAFVEAPPSAAAVVAATAAVPSRPVKKKSSGKPLLILGGLAAFFVLVLVGAGGGWYIYENYGAAPPVEPSPTPEATFEPSPTPEPTFESVLPSNSTDDSNSNSTSDTNVSSTVPTVEPTPLPTATQTQSVPRTDPRPGDTRPKPTPKPAPTKSVQITKPTPKPKNTPGPRILQ